MGPIHPDASRPSQTCLIFAFVLFVEISIVSAVTRVTPPSIYMTQPHAGHLGAHLWLINSYVDDHCFQTSIDGPFNPRRPSVSVLGLFLHDDCSGNVATMHIISSHAFALRVMIACQHPSYWQHKINSNFTLFHVSTHSSQFSFVSFVTTDDQVMLTLAT